MGRARRRTGEVLARHVLREGREDGDEGAAQVGPLEAVEVARRLGLRTRLQHQLTARKLLGRSKARERERERERTHELLHLHLLVDRVLELGERAVRVVVGLARVEVVERLASLVLPALHEEPPRRLGEEPKLEGERDGRAGEGDVEGDAEGAVVEAPALVRRPRDDGCSQAADVCEGGRREGSAQVLDNSREAVDRAAPTSTTCSYDAQTKRRRWTHSCTC